MSKNRKHKNVYGHTYEKKLQTHVYHQGKQLTINFNRFLVKQNVELLHILGYSKC
jgi:hypothetical protein